MRWARGKRIKEEKEEDWRQRKREEKLFQKKKRKRKGRRKRKGNRKEEDMKEREKEVERYWEGEVGQKDHGPWNTGKVK